MTMIPDSVDVRVYNVGFGDCILLTFNLRKTARSRSVESYRVLIDFGSTGRNADSPGMLEVAKQIVEDCRVSKTRSRLDAIVITHRHRDHMAGFGGKSGAYLVENLSEPPKLIMQPWTENPKADDPVVSFHEETNGAAMHIKSLRKSQTISASILKEIQVRRDMKMERETDREVEFFGAKNLPFLGVRNKESDLDDDENLNVQNAEDLTNEDAIERLQNWKSDESKPKYEYLSSGEKTALGKGNLIPRLKVDVLGPVGPAHWEQLKAHGDSDELWKRLHGLRDDSPINDDNPLVQNGKLSAKDADKTGEGEFVKFDQRKGPYGVKPIFDRKFRVPETEVRKDNVRWLVEHLDALRGRQLLNFVRALDSHLNNTSLVLLFQFGEFRMLFAGDAEVASWQLISENNGSREENDVIKKLRGVDLYKVGHHGSDNATPKLSLWRHLTESRDEDHPLHCLLSTQATRFRNKIPNRELYETMIASPNLRLMSTASLFDEQGPVQQPDGWEAIRGNGNVVFGYVRNFSVKKK